MLLGRLAVPLLTLALVVLGLAPAHADDRTATSLQMSSTRAYAGEPTTLTLVLTDATGAPVAGEVEVQRRSGAEWRPLTTVTTDQAGHAALTAVLGRTNGANVFRAGFLGSETHAPAGTGPHQARLRKRRSVLVVAGPDSVVDERSTVVRVRWRAGGAPVPGTVRLLRRLEGEKRWRKVKVLRTGADGRAALRVRPRVDSRWKATARGQAWATGARSRVHRLDNLPPGRPVRLPRHAPRPRIKLPPQRRAVGKGAHPVISRIPNGVWRQMTGRSWHRGCPVGRSGLRLVRINYWGYDGYRYRGELVAAVGAAPRMAAALREMYDRRFPIRAMYRVDRFGWSDKLHGGDDYKSMAAGNTSAFNCRSVVNKPGVRSPHTYGHALDVNTWENPYRSRTGLVPNSWWQYHSHPKVAWRSGSHPVVRIMRKHGLRWTYGLGDTQHFDAVRRGRVIVPRGCEDVVCH